MVKALVLERKKRSTAGTRMDSLIGQAAKDDDEFWGHSTWGEEKGDVSDDGSFHESDEESDAKIDTFDSDFNDSEGEAEEEGGGEVELLQEERMAKRAAGKKRMMDGVNAGRELMQKKKNAAKRKKAIRGSDDNAGLVLNFPGAAPNVKKKFYLKAAPAAVKPPPLPKVKVENAQPSRRSSRAKISKFSVSEVVGKRSFRTSTINNSIETSSTNDSTRQSSSQITKKNKHKRKFAQDELLLEALSKTEGENQRWLLNRKRQQVEENTRAELKKKMSQQSADRKVVSKFNSRRGCLNTFTFPAMDHVPDIFTQPKSSSEQRLQKIEKLRRENICVITGKKARYLDPKSRLGYHDLASFKELRRRLDAGEPVGHECRSKLSSRHNGDRIQTVKTNSNTDPDPNVKFPVKVEDEKSNTDPDPNIKFPVKVHVEDEKCNSSLPKETPVSNIAQNGIAIPTKINTEKNNAGAGETKTFSKPKPKKEAKKVTTNKRESSFKTPPGPTKKSKKSVAASIKEVKTAVVKSESKSKTEIKGGEKTNSDGRKPNNPEEEKLAAPKSDCQSNRKRANSNVSHSSNGEKKTKDATKTSSRPSEKTKVENIISKTASNVSVPAASNSTPAVLLDHIHVSSTSANTSGIENAALAQNLLHNPASFNQGNNHLIQSQFLGQSIPNMPMNPMSTTYQPYDMNNINPGMLNNLHHGSNPGMFRYGQSNQLPQYQQMLAPPAMDVASMLAMSLNPHGMSMQSLSHYPQQHMQHQPQIQMMNPMLSRQNQSAPKKGSAKKFEDGRQH